MMKKAVMQFTACCLATGIAVSSFGMAALADNSGMTLAGLSEKNIVVVSTTLAGLSETDSVVVAEGATGTEKSTDTDESAAETSVDADESASETSVDTDESASETSVDTDESASETSADTSDVSADEAAATESAETETETELVYDTSMSGETAFGQCDNYINVRSDASADSEVVGKIYNNNSVTILGQLGDWYEIQSGNVTGYVNAAYIATGEEADAIAEETAYNVATVNAEGLWVHSEASEDSETIAMVYYSDQMEVVSYEGDWMKVVLEDGTYGYVNAWYVDYDSYYSTGETLEEEQERLDEQWLEYLAEQEAAAAEAAAAEAAAAETEAAATTTTTTTETTTSSSTSLDEATAAVDAAYQAYLEAQEAADAATHQADEQLVYDTYDAAVAAYQEYLNAVNAKNEIKYGSSSSETTTSTSETTASTTETTTTEATTIETATTEAATETATTEAVQTEAAQTETAATEAATEAATTTTTTSSSSSSSTGQSIANYAVQFVGNPYVYGGTSLTNGADCSGFTQSVFAHFGISISRTAASQASGGTSVSLSDIQAGDLLFYSNGGGISHVALYIGNGQVVHASTSSTGIIISSYNYRTPVCARRYWS